jgi:hypothetical protein
MKHRRVFSVPDCDTAKAAIAAARANGIEDDHVSLIARQDIELETLPPERIEARTDTVPAALRGAAGGGAVGLLAGLIAIPAFGVTIAGAGLLAALGAMVGTWSSALMGSALPSDARRRFEEEVEAGRILVVIDGNAESLSAAEAALKRLGAEPLPYDHLSAAS